MKASLTLTGVTEWANQLMEIAEGTPEVMEELVVDLGLFLEATAKNSCPVEHGRIRASIGHFTPEHLNPDESGDLQEVKDASESDAHFQIVKVPGGVRAEVGTNVGDAEYVEFGMSTMAATPYLEPAIKETEQYLPYAVIDRLEAHLNVKK